jgi:hypothetical protein
MRRWEILGKRREIDRRQKEIDSKVRSWLYYRPPDVWKEWIVKHALIMVAIALGGLHMQLACAQPAGWKVIKDRSGTCQIAVPANWTPLSAPGFVNSPESTSTVLTASLQPFAPLPEDILKTLNIGKLYENSASRVFYVSKPEDASGHVRYHVEVPGKTSACIAEMSLTSSYPEDEAKKIAMTVASIK